MKKVRHYHCIMFSKSSLLCFYIEDNINEDEEEEIDEENETTDENSNPQSEKTIKKTGQFVLIYK